MNIGQKIAVVARGALSNSNFVKAPGMCSKFCRQVYEKATQDYSRKYFGASAKATCRLMRDRGKTVQFTGNKDLQAGDFLFKNVGPFGHVGIYLGGGIVAENATTSIGRISGFKGMRSLAQFGKIDEVGRQ